MVWGREVTKKQHILLAFAILAIFSLLLFVIFGENGLADLQLLQQERDSLLQRNAELARENLLLSREIERLKNDPKYLENIARQELGVVGKDELIFKLGKGQKDKN